MRDLFYGILSFLLIGTLYISYTSDRLTNIDKYKGTIVIDKNYTSLVGNTMTFMFDNDSIANEFVYDIVSEKYNVGDTIK